MHFNLNSGFQNGLTTETANRTQKKRAALTAAAAVLYRMPFPMRTPLERDAARVATRAYCDQRIAQMWARVKV